MTVETRKLLREVFVLGYTVGKGKDKLNSKENKKANAEFEKFILAIKNVGVKI